VSDDGLFIWGMLVTMFLFLAFILTLRQMFENRMQEREEKLRREKEAIDIAKSNSGL
jgi:hypothetical protein